MLDSKHLHKACFEQRAQVHISWKNLRKKTDKTLPTKKVWKKTNDFFLRPQMKNFQKCQIQYSFDDLDFLKKWKFDTPLVWNIFYLMYDFCKFSRKKTLIFSSARLTPLIKILTIFKQLKIIGFQISSRYKKNCWYLIFLHFLTGILKFTRVYPVGFLGLNNLYFSNISQILLDLNFYGFGAQQNVLFSFCRAKNKCTMRLLSAQMIWNQWLLFVALWSFQSVIISCQSLSQPN